MTPVQFQSVNNSEVQGYSIRLELITENNKTQQIAFSKKDKVKKLVKMPDFQFSFSPIYKKFVRELKDDESKP